MRLTEKERVELAIFDAAIDAEDARMTLEEYEMSVHLEAKAHGLSRRYYPATLPKEERIAHRKRWKAAWYQSNRERLDERKRQSVKRTQKQYAPFGKMIRDARMNAGLARSDVAVLLDRSYGTIAKYENGEVGFDWEMFRAIYPKLGPSPDDFPKR